MPLGRYVLKGLRHLGPFQDDDPHPSPMDTDRRLRRLEALVRERDDARAELRALQHRFGDHRRATDLRLHGLEIAFETMLESATYPRGQPVGFNRQRERQAVFQDVSTQLRFTTLVETGCFMGNTTGYLAESSLHRAGAHTSPARVYACDKERVFIAVARNRLATFDNIELERSDSRDFLVGLQGRVDTEAPTFFYLDAHWGPDLPLIKEVRCVFEGWRRPVVLIDDFRVDHDDGYRFDSYAGEALGLNLLAPVIEDFELHAFFPAAPSEKETGARRGSIWLSRDPASTSALTRGALRRARSRP